MIIKLDKVAKFSQEYKGKVNGWVPEGELVVKATGCESLTITLYYTKAEEGFKVFTEKPEGIKEEDLRTLLIEVQVNGMFGGPLVCFSTPDCHRPVVTDLLQMKRAYAPVASLAVHLPEGGVSARDGIGDWIKAITLSKTKLGHTEE